MDNTIAYVNTTQCLGPTLDVNSPIVQGTNYRITSTTIMSSTLFHFEESKCHITKTCL